MSLNVTRGFGGVVVLAIFLMVKTTTAEDLAGSLIPLESFRVFVAKKKGLVLDVRLTEVYESGHIPGLSPCRISISKKGTDG